MEVRNRTTRWDFVIRDYCSGQQILVANPTGLAQRIVRFLTSIATQIVAMFLVAGGRQTLPTS